MPQTVAAAINPPGLWQRSDPLFIEYCILLDLLPLLLRSPRMPGHSVVQAAHTGLSCTMGTAVDLPVTFKSMTDDAAPAMGAGRRQCVHGAFETVKNISLLSNHDLKCLVVLVTANVTSSHNQSFRFRLHPSQNKHPSRRRSWLPINWHKRTLHCPDHETLACVAGPGALERGKAVIEVGRGVSVASTAAHPQPISSEFVEGKLRPVFAKNCKTS